MSVKTLRKIPLERFVDLKVDYAFKQFLALSRIKTLLWLS